MNEASTVDTFSLLDWGVTPWTVFVAFLVPLLLLAFIRKTYPTLRLALLAGIPLVVALPSPVVPRWWWMVVCGFGAAVALLALVDLLLIPRANRR